MRTRVVITALTLRREDRRNVSGYASELEYFAAETHLVVVACDIFISFIGLSSRSVLCRLTLCLFKS